MSSIPPPPQDPPQYYQQTPFQPQKKSNVGLIIAIIVVVGACLIIPIFAAILLPVFAQAKNAAQKTQALSDIKQSATSLLIYQADFDDHFPPDMSNSDALEASLTDYLTDYGSHWHIQGTPTQGNPNLAGKLSVDVKTPQSTIMLYCIPPSLNKKAVVAAADGSARVVDANDLKLEISSNSYQVPSN
ncbi:MAG: hypothetical protein ACKVQS_10720 [Fimbriimonadaceae bacterium]